MNAYTRDRLRQVGAKLAEKSGPVPRSLVSTEFIADVDAHHLVGIDRRVVRILRREQGWTSRTDLLRGLRTVPADDLTRCLSSLYRRGLVDYRFVWTATKPIEEWRLLA